MMMPSVPLPDNFRRTISGKLKARWKLDTHRHIFIGPKQAEFDPSASLPTGSDVVPTVPALAAQSPAELSTAEKDLARYIQIILPSGTEPQSVIAQITQWPCLESATISPQVELPGT
jgi:hypothetical protein